MILRLILDFKLIPETVVRDSTCVNWTPRVCAIFVKVWFYSAKNCISASDSSQTENPINTRGISYNSLRNQFEIKNQPQIHYRGALLWRMLCSGESHDLVSWLE